MHPVQFILPSIATLILGTAILLPLRDAKREVRGEPHQSSDQMEWQVEHGGQSQVCETAPVPASDRGARVEGTLEAAASVSPPRRDERVVPITRRRLRAAAERVSWPTLDAPASSPADGDERLNDLRALLSDATRAVPEELLILTCREEDQQARRLALARLARGNYQSCADTFAEALRTGDDDERALAIDGLSRLGAREALTRALNDRVDALAARAALAFVGSRRRAEFVDALDRYVDPFRRDAILDCLAGLIE